MPELAKWLEVLSKAYCSMGRKHVLGVHEGFKHFSQLVEPTASSKRL
jgi:hypothetical protein